ncbi:MAG TPA: hypothetical protein DER13_05430 [Clostridiales bacterium]|jgi:hypothetical protein|nr:hypothetical protein [Clostridiales bacterium]
MFKSDNELLSSLLDKVENHDIQLPDFQRGWVWEDNRIKALLASLTLKYPVGAIMLLESGGDFHFKCKNIEGSGDEYKNPESMILDGQQRMTSTFQAMRSKNAVSTWSDQKKAIKRFYYLDIEKALNTTTDRIDAIISVDENKQIRGNIGRDVLLDLSTEELEFKNKMIPFNKMTQANEINEWRNKYQDYYNFEPNIIKEYQQIDTNIIQPILNYRIPIIKVLKEAPKEAVCQVFENVNQGGVPLTVFELLTATFAADNFDLKEHWNKVKEIFEQYETLKKFDNTSFLIAMTLLIAMRKNSTVSCKRKDVLNLDYKDYEKNEEDLVNGFKKAYKLLVEMNIYSVYDIPYSTQLIPLAVICTLLDKEFENSSIKEKIKQWFWCGVFGELYGGANETRYALDVKQVYDWIKGKEELPKTINDCNFNTMRLLGLQTKNSAAYKGIMALILNNRSCDWINGMEMGVQTYLDERSDIHHIFPQDYCIKMNYDKKKWNSIINKTPLFFSTNRYIGGTSPSDYMNKIIRNKNISKEQLKSHISSHMINADLLENNKFEEFIIDRAIKILDGIERCTGKKITDRNSEDVVNYFGTSLKKKEENND